MNSTGENNELRIKSAQNIVTTEIESKVINVYCRNSDNFIMIVHESDDTIISGIDTNGKKVNVGLDEIEFITYVEENEC